MSGRIVGEVLDHAPADLKPADMLVLVALAESAPDKTRIARYQSDVATLAHRTRLSAGTVRNTLTRLCRRGLIRPLIHARQGRSQEYELAKLSQQHRFNGMVQRHP